MKFIENIVGNDKKILEEILIVLRRLYDRLFPEVANGVKIILLGGKHDMPQPVVSPGDGIQHVAEADALLNGVTFPAGFPSGSAINWTVSDQGVTLSPAPQANQVLYTMAASDTNTAFVLNVSVQMPAVSGVTPAALINSVTVTVTPGVTPPPPSVPNGVVVNLLS